MVKPAGNGIYHHCGMKATSFHAATVMFSGMGRVTPRPIIRITFFYILSVMQDLVPGREFNHASSHHLLIESTLYAAMRNRCAFVSRVVSSYRTNAV
jgi:hypothetical protein